MARVYRAHDPRLNRRVALKVLRVDTEAEPESAPDASARAMREARAAAALDHPNAISVFDVGEADGRLFIAMELVVGQEPARASWATRASAGRRSSAGWSTRPRALGAAHDRGLVHRDVKPENIMVRSDGVVKVLDFGIAKRMRVDVTSPGTFDDGGRSHSTLSGGIVGTPWYLSPEQLRGEVVDGRADQFAWAVTTYELLTGRSRGPRASTASSSSWPSSTGRPTRRRSSSRRCRRSSTATIMKSLAKGPKQRFEAMEYVVNALEGVTSNSRRSWAEIQRCGHVEDRSRAPHGGDGRAAPPAVSGRRSRTTRRRSRRTSRGRARCAGRSPSRSSSSPPRPPSHSPRHG